VKQPKKNRVSELGTKKRTDSVLHLSLTRQSIENDWPGSENQRKATEVKVGDCHTFEEGEMTQGRKNGETRNDGEQRVRKSDNARVENGGLVTWAMGSVGGQNTKGKTDREKDLRAGDRPNFTLCPQDCHIPNSNVFFDSIFGTFQGETLSEENKEEEDRQTHGKEGNASGPLDTNGNGSVHYEPYEEGVSHVLSDDTGRCAVIAECSGSNNLVDKVIDGLLTGDIVIAPGSSVAPRVEEGVDDPGDKDRVVGYEHKSTRYTTQTNSSQARVESSKDANISGLEELSETDLEDGEGDSNKEQGHEVWDKEGASSVDHG
jgi:hypothetical protein